jgi:hypothetical protein
MTQERTTMGSTPEDPTPAPETPASRDAQYWAKAVSKLDVTSVPDGAINLNVAGRRVTSPMQGFGKMWQKTYRINVGDGVTPQELIKEWKAHFPEFWPEGNRFYGPLAGISPGDVALLNLSVPGHLKLSTGVFVIYADDESFTFITPEGHGFAGLITFSAAGESDGTIAQVQALLRANDPFYEVGMMLGVQPRMEDRFWTSTLKLLADHFGIDGDVAIGSVCVDKKRQWRNAKNIRHNAFIRTVFYTLGTPIRAVRRTPTGESTESKEPTNSPDA